jgi:hypothetical protein
MAVTYDNNTDYQKLIEQAVMNGDYTSAAKLEQQRNAKISDLNASGTNQWNAQHTTNYAQYLGGGYQSTGTHNDSSVSSADQAAINNAKAQYYNAMSLNDQAGMDAAHQAAEAIRAKYGYSGGTDGSENIALSQPIVSQPVVSPTGGGFTMPSFDFDLNSKPTFESQYGSQIDQLLNELLNRDSFSYDVAAPVYKDTYTDRINAAISGLENRDLFSYNAEADPLYQQFKTQYNREGDRSMRDTLAEVASHAGGMNSSAVTAAQEANNYYAAQVADKIPELRQLAYEMYVQDFNDDVAMANLLRSQGESEYNRYRDEYSDYLNERNYAYQQYLNDIEKQVTDLGLIKDMDDTQYNRYRDTMSDWRNDRDFAYGTYRDEVGDYKWQTDFDYQVGRDQVADSQWQQSFDYDKIRDQVNDSWRNEEWEYGKDRDEIEDGRYENETAYSRAMELLNAGAMPDDALLEAAGISKDTASSILATVTAFNNKSLYDNADGKQPVEDKTPKPGNTENNDTGKTGYDNGTLTLSQVAEMQRFYGIEDDGYWGPKSEAELGMGADAAWAEYQRRSGGLTEKMKDVTIQGKPLEEYESAASNYRDVANTLSTMKKNGATTEELLDAIREAYKEGVLNLTDYSTLYNRYRG